MRNNDYIILLFSACFWLTFAIESRGSDGASSTPPSGVIDLGKLRIYGDIVNRQKPVNNNAVVASKGDDADVRIPVLRERAEVVSRQLMALAEGMQNIKLLSLYNDKLRGAMKDPAFRKVFGKAPEDLMQAGELAQKIYDFKKAWDYDIAENNGIQGVAAHPVIVFIHSHTLEQLAQLGLDKWGLPKFYEVLEDRDL